jgi:hypothetical protein
VTIGDWDSDVLSDRYLELGFRALCTAWRTLLGRHLL